MRSMGNKHTTTKNLRPQAYKKLDSPSQDLIKIEIGATSNNRTWYTIRLAVMCKTTIYDGEEHYYYKYRWHKCIETKIDKEIETYSIRKT